MTVEQIATERDALQAQLVRLRAALEAAQEHISHASDCPARHSGECLCLRSEIAEALANTSPAPAMPWRIKAVNPLRSAAYVWSDGGNVQCALPDGTRASLSYAGVLSDKIMECNFALKDARNGLEALKVMTRFGAKKFTYHLLDTSPAPVESVNKELLDGLKTIEGTGYSDDGGQWAANIASAAIAKAEKAGG